ncbi:hypothetical protein E4U44_007987 [Claviceps purpurea]|nr:hypothetical protein E4U44_007987 [Claviceps purpurea]
MKQNFHSSPTDEQIAINKHYLVSRISIALHRGSLNYHGAPPQMILTDLGSQASHKLQPGPGPHYHSAGNAVAFTATLATFNSSWACVGAKSMLTKSIWIARALVNEVIGTVVGMTWKDGTATHGASDPHKKASEPYCYFYAEPLVTELLKVLNLSTHIE